MIYNSIYNLPIWNFQKINKTGDFGFLYEQYRKPEKKAESIWSKIMDEYIKEFGVNELLIEYLELQKQAIEFYKQAYIDGDRAMKNFARIAEEEAEKLLENNNSDDNKLYAFVAKQMGIQINPVKTSTYEFMNYLKLING
jgi:hypothetical protein